MSGVHCAPYISSRSVTDSPSRSVGIHLAVMLVESSVRAWLYPMVFRFMFCEMILRSLFVTKCWCRSACAVKSHLRPM